MSRPATSRLKVNPALGAPPTLEWRPLPELGIDPVYQRAITAATSQTLIRRIASFWDWGLCQPLAVARRPDGSLMVVDGQHRLEAARLRRDVPHLPCVITSYPNQGDEAAAFVALNQQRRPLSKIDLFKAALAAEDDQAVAIARVITEAGLTLAGHTNYTAWKPGNIANISGIQSAWAAHGEPVVLPALRALRLAFEGQILRYGGTIFPGIVGLLVADLSARRGADFDRLVRALSKQGQKDWRRAILTHSGQTGERRDKAAKAVLQRAFLLTEPTPISSPPPPPIKAGPPLSAVLKHAETAWCEQCDQRVSGAKAAQCTSQFCSLKVKAA